MKCLQIHNDYLVPGGETASAHLIAEELENNGIEVIKYYKKNTHLVKKKNMVSKLLVGINSLFNLNTIKEVEEILRVNKVDFALIHNTSPLISNSIYHVLHKNKIPIIKYVQNYNLLCLNGSKNNNVEICKKCISGNSFVGVRNKCYKESYTFSFLKFINQNIFNLLYKSKIKKFIAISDFIKEEHIKFGEQSNKIEVIHHFSREAKKINLLKSKKTNNKYFLYMGRLSKEKGIITLLETFKKQPGKKLYIIGKGPMRDDVIRFINVNQCFNIEYLGFKKGKEKDELVSNAYCLLVPSEWDEPFGRIVIESYSVGTPVITTDRGGLSELVNEGLTGYKYKSKDQKEFSHKVTKMWELDIDEYNVMRNNCLIKYNEEFSSSVYFRRIKNLIDANIEERRK